MIYKMRHLIRSTAINRSEELARMRYEPEISGLRGLALLIVVAGHFIQRIERFGLPGPASGEISRFVIDSLASPGGGVYLFFSVSGYLIAQSFERMRPLSIANIMRFYLRRTTRIALPYMLIISLTWIFMVISGWNPPLTNLYNTRPESLTLSLLVSLVYLHGFTFGSYPRLFPPGWTLEIEMQFYVLSPLICASFQWLIRIIGLVRVSVLSVVLATLVGISLENFVSTAFHFTVFGYLQFFIIGIVAYHFRKDDPQRSSSCVSSVIGWGSLFVFITFQPWITILNMEIFGRMVLIALMFYSLTQRFGTFYRFCTITTLVKAGLTSFSTYLVHLQVFYVTAYIIKYTLKVHYLLYSVAVNITISVSALYFFSRILHRYIERPAHVFSKKISVYSRR